MILSSSGPGPGQVQSSPVQVKSIQVQIRSNQVQRGPGPSLGFEGTNPKISKSRVISRFWSHLLLVVLTTLELLEGVKSQSFFGTLDKK